MEIIRISDQTDGTLYEFYVRERDEYLRRGDELHAEMLDTMVRLLRHLESIDAPTVFGVTSHFRLRLVTQDDYRSPDVATVEAVVDGPNTFGLDVAYPMPPDDAPWDNAWVRGLAFDVPMAAEMIRAALIRSANAP
jgi:hypothetical protein